MGRDELRVLTPFKYKMLFDDTGSNVVNKYVTTLMDSLMYGVSPRMFHMDKAAEEWIASHDMAQVSVAMSSNSDGQLVLRLF